MHARMAATHHRTVLVIGGRFPNVGTITEARSRSTKRAEILISRFPYNIHHYRYNNKLLYYCVSVSWVRPHDLP